MNLYSTTEMKQLLERHDFFFKKNLGQNFLMNQNQAKKIALSAHETLSGTKKSLALEIGPGAGSLTLQLSEMFDQVVAIEIDPHLISVLNESLETCKNVKIINTDALQFDYASLLTEYEGYEFCVCANLPYYITSEVIMRLLESPLTLASITVLIQKEACNRLVTKPGSPEYGAITAAVSYYAKAEKLFLVGPGNFIPRPKVDSAVLRLKTYDVPPVSVADKKLFFRLIRAAFAARRKTLANSLAGTFQNEFSKEILTTALEKSGIDPNRRGETLTLSEFAALSDTLSKTKDVTERT